MTAELPRASVDTTIDPSYDRVRDIFVPFGGNLQAALDVVMPGEIIELQAGGTWVGNYILRKDVADAWIYIRSSRYDDLLAPGNRVGPQHLALMAKIETQTVNEQALRTEHGAHHVRFIGIEFSSNSNSNAHVIQLGPGYPNHATTLTELPHHITFDRCYVHGPPVENSGNGINADGKHIAIVDSTHGAAYHPSQHIDVNKQR